VSTLWLAGYLHARLTFLVSATGQLVKLLLNHMFHAGLFQLRRPAGCSVVLECFFSLVAKKPISLRRYFQMQNVLKMESSK
jgi:hypothetical protein